MAMLDGIRAVLEAGKTPQELERSISKKAGEEDFYLETNREYRSEENVFTYYTPEERAELFGHAPATVWENFRAFDRYADRLGIITSGDESLGRIIGSYREQMTMKWITEFHDRRIPNAMEFVRRCAPQHDQEDISDLDEKNWARVRELRAELGKDTVSRKSILTLAKEALDLEEYDRASELELTIQNKTEELRDAYNEYRKNLF
jgi:glutamine synthetase